MKLGIAKKEIARRLGRDIKTVRRELSRNSTRVTVDQSWKKIYEPVHAHSVAMGRKRNAWEAKKPLKSKKIFSYVTEHLRESWSPEQIAGRLKSKDHPTDLTWQICHETIYAFIYKEETDIAKEKFMIL